ncbi:FG-GAP repeat domain-containing protein [Candidatus Clostridium stratigraminis]|uniref:FG-GAP repeat domain-containing protein n=1 Tax=Candidatus Clostridium stratigraminis TaxID=3381661 RepID=A0ABW8T2I5_9CLOT
MKFRVIFLKKKHIYYIILSIILIILFIILLLTKKATETFNTLVSDNKMIRADLTGDGKKDILYIKTEKDKYYLEVNTGEKSFYLEPDKKLATAGIYDEFNPLKITLMDITRDKTPEIFIQSNQKGTSLQHIFFWNGDKFNDIFCSSNNIIGFYDSSNNKTPKFVTGKIGANKIELSSYMFMYDKGKLENIVFNYNDNFLGRDTIYSFVKYIEGLPQSEANSPSNIFYPGLTGQDLSVIGRLAGEQNTYSYQNSVFKDSKSDKNGTITDVIWTLNFKAVSNISIGKTKNYTLNVYLRPEGKSDAANYFKIVAITLNQ